jgi:hypothetical protein
MAKHLDWRLERERFSSVVGEVVDQVGRAVEAISLSIGASMGASMGAASTTDMNGLALALAGPDANWVARTREVVRFYSPAGDAPAGDAPVGQPTPGGAPPAGQPDDLPTYSQADMAAWEREQQRYEAARAVEREKQEKLKLNGTIMAGTGAGLLVLGGVAVGVGVPFLGMAGAVVAVSLGGVGITAGIVLLIIGIVLAVRANKQLAKG